jgi:hypothetical protein
MGVLARAVKEMLYPLSVQRPSTQQEVRMKPLWRALTLAVVAAAAVATLAAQAMDPRVGTWKMNVEKSKSSQPPPQSQVLTVEAAVNGETVTSILVAADGTKTTTKYTATYDGKPYPLTGAQTADMVSLKRISTHTTERTDTKDGKVIQTITRVVSPDGKTMTTTVQGTDAEGKPISRTAVFDKQ